jgi:ABC-2 type transport system ATP-binding protein
VSFSIEPGELVAFLGPNGAGKTTTLKMLSGLLYPTGGELTVLGNTPFDKKPDFLRRFSFVMGQRHQLWWELPAVDTFRLNAAIFGLDDTAYRRRLKELDALLGLDPLWNTPVKKLSLGQRMKMELACSLLHDPELLLLDEPTIGLDVVMQKTLRDFVARINREKKTTVLLTSHNMEDIESLCRRVIVIHNGTILFDGDLPDLVARFVPAKRVGAVLAQEIPAERLARFGDVQNINGPRVEWEVPRGEVSRRVADILKELPVNDLTVEEMPLEDVVRRIFKEGSAVGDAPLVSAT